MSDIDELTPLMHRAVDGVRSDVPKLVAGGLVRGRTWERRARTRRTALTVGGPLAVAAAVAAVVVMSAAGSRPTASVPMPISVPVAAAVSSSAAAPTPASSAVGKLTSSPVPKGMVPMTGQTAIQTLIDLLPADGHSSTYEAQPDATNPFDIGGTVKYVRGGASATVMVLFIAPAGSSFDCTGWGSPPDETCTDTTGADGSHLVQMKNRGGYWFAQVHRPDGSLVMASENAVPPGQTVVTGPTPPLPLTMDELVTIASSSRWQTTVDAGLASKAPQVSTPVPPAWKTAAPTG